jgi:hypothetical protein
MLPGEEKGRSNVAFGERRGTPYISQTSLAQHGGGKYIEISLWGQKLSKVKVMLVFETIQCAVHKPLISPDLFDLHSQYTSTMTPIHASATARTLPSRQIHPHLKPPSPSRPNPSYAHYSPPRPPASPSPHNPPHTAAKPPCRALSSSGASSGPDTPTCASQLRDTRPESCLTFGCI